MNLERAHTIFEALHLDLEATKLVAVMQRIVNALTSLSQQPQNPQQMEALAQARMDLRTAIGESAMNDWPPAWRQALSDMGIDDLLGSRLQEHVEATIGSNEITPTLALEATRDLSERLTTLHLDLSNILTAFDHLGVDRELPEPGAAELTFSIPRSAVHQNLPELEIEFRRLQQIVGPFQELILGGREPLHVNSLASSDYTVYVSLGLGVAAAVGHAVDKCLDVYLKILTIREKRDGLSGLVPEDVLEQIDAVANRKMKEAITEYVDQIIDALPLVDDRINELRADLNYAMNMIANRIDEGFNFSIAATPEEGEPQVDDEDQEPAEPSAHQQALADVIELAPRLTYVNTTGQRILSLPEKPDNDRNSPRQET